MPLAYTFNKKHIYRWRENNVERRREINKLSMRRKYAWNKISKEFLNILFET